MAVPGFSVWGRKPEACVLVMVLPCMTLGRPLLFLGFSSASIKEEGGMLISLGFPSFDQDFWEISQLGRVIVDTGASSTLPFRPVMVSEMVSIGTLVGHSSWCRRLCKLLMLLEGRGALGCFDPCSAAGRGDSGRSRVESRIGR